MKRLLDNGVSEAELKKWTGDEIDVFGTLPDELFVLLLSKYIPKVTDIENMCEALGNHRCDAFKIFKGIFYTRYGKELWVYAHKAYPHFSNDSLFLRAFEMAVVLLNMEVQLPSVVFQRDMELCNVQMFSNRTLQISVQTRDDSVSGKQLARGVIMQTAIDLFYSNPELTHFPRPLDLQGDNYVYVYELRAEIEIKKPCSNIYLVTLAAFIYNLIADDYEARATTFDTKTMQSQPLPNIGCSHCDSTQPLTVVCGSCVRAFYCNEACRKQNYTKHAAVCKK